MATKIVTKNSSTASAVPTASDLVQGELAVNVADKRLFTEDNAGAIVELGTNPYNFTANHNGSAKLATTATGIDVTGTATVDGLVVDGNAVIDGGATDNTVLTLDSGTPNTYLKITDSNSTNGAFIGATTNDLNLYPNNTLSAKFSAGGDISFYEDTGTTAKLFWDASAESLGIGGAATDGTFQVKGTGVNTGIPNVLIDASFADASNATGLTIGHRTDETTAVIAPRTATGNLAFYNYNGGWSESMRISSAGNVGIGNSNPSAFNSLGATDKLVVGDSTVSNLTLFGTNYGSLAFADSNTSGSTAQYAGLIQYYHADNSMQFYTSSTERMRISGAEVYVGHTGGTAPWAMTGSAFGISLMGSGGFIGAARSGAEPLLLNRTSSDGAIINLRKDGTTVGSIGALGANAYINSQGGTLKISTVGTERYNFDLDQIYPSVDNDTNLGLSSKRFKDLYLSESVKLSANDAGGVGSNSIDFAHTGHTAGPSAQIHVDYTGDFRANLLFKINKAQANSAPTEVARFTNSGSLLVGKTSTAVTTGCDMRPTGNIVASASADNPLYLNRSTNDGDIAVFAKDGTTVGSIGTNGGDLFIGTGVISWKFFDAGGAIIPADASGGAKDNAVNLGAANARMEIIFAGTGTINTSDRNEKQDIEALSDAEQRVAVAAKGLMRKFRWKDAVAEKGNNARIHFGIIAQDLQAAFEAEGLDAARYGMWCSDTWTDIDTGEERTRLGVRYSELLAFIISAI